MMKKIDLLLQQNEFLTNSLESSPHHFYIVEPNDYTIKTANSAFGVGKGNIA